MFVNFPQGINQVLLDKHISHSLLIMFCINNLNMQSDQTGYKKVQ